MGQIKIFGLSKELNAVKNKLSDLLHSCVVDAFSFPGDKRFHRFFPMNKEDFIFPEGRSDRYTIIELSLFEGRSVESKKKFIRLIYERFHKELNIGNEDIEITIFETPKCNWGIRGKPGDELALNYQVNV